MVKKYTEYQKKANHPLIVRFFDEINEQNKTNLNRFTCCKIVNRQYAQMEKEGTIDQYEDQERIQKERLIEKTNSGMSEIEYSEDQERIWREELIEKIDSGISEPDYLKLVNNHTGNQVIRVRIDQ